MKHENVLLTGCNRYMVLGVFVIYNVHCSPYLAKTTCFMVLTKKE